MTAKVQFFESTLFRALGFIYAAGTFFPSCSGSGNFAFLIRSLINAV